MKIIKSKIFPSTVSLFTAALLVLLAAGQEAARAQSRGTPLKEIVLENGLRLIYEHDASSQ